MISELQPKWDGGLGQIRAPNTDLNYLQQMSSESIRQHTEPAHAHKSLRNTKWKRFWRWMLSNQPIQNGRYPSFLCSRRTEHSDFAWTMQGEHSNGTLFLYRAWTNASILLVIPGCSRHGTLTAATCKRKSSLKIAKKCFPRLITYYSVSLEFHSA